MRPSTLLRVKSYGSSFVALLLVLGGILASCETSTVQPVVDQVGYEYFPLAVGRYRIYAVEDVKYLSIGRDSSRYQIKERINATYGEVNEPLNYEIYRYRRATALQPWTLDSVWSAYRTNTLAVRKENGLPYVKLVFPLRSTSTWDPNMINAQAGSGLRGRYANLNQPFSQNGLNFARTLQVVYEDDSSCRDKKIWKETWAEDIGLVRQQRLEYVYVEDPNAPCLPPFRVSTGIRYTATLLEHGTE